MATEYKTIPANLLPEASSVTDADMILIIQGGRPKRALPSAMKGERGDNVYLGVSSTHIQWKIGKNGTWQNLLALESIRGYRGYKPVFRKVGGTLQVKYENEADSAYTSIFDRTELMMRFSDLTADEIEMLKLHFSDLSGEEIDVLRQPAIDAAAEVRGHFDAWNAEEQARADAETVRQQAEQSRNDAEDERQQAEQSREASETERRSAETSRVDAETAREEAETSRVNEESKRVEAENLRKDQETARVNAENAREVSEQARISAENERDDSEQERQANESTREANEQARMEAEGERIAEEDQRKASEESRNDAEAERETNEAARKANENARQQAESTRVATEIEREANELTRKSNESTRQTQETERQTNTATAIANAETATDAANTAAQNAIKAKEETEAATALANELNDHPWIIRQGVWYKWNTETDQYESTGLQAKGDTGASFNIVGVYQTIDALKAAVPDGTEVDGVYAVGTGDPYDYYAWAFFEDEWQWVNQGQLRGPEGKSAYEVWLTQGNAGKSESDYIAYLMQPATEAAETANQAAEAATQSKESADQAEALRAKAEQLRAASESARKANETSRVQAESDRASAETERRLQEEQRSDAETARNNNEDTRIANETVRTEAESIRKSSETQRSNAENLRRESEITRVTAETARSEAEDTRKENEQTRQLQEENRQTNTANAISGANNATNNANAAADNANTAATKANEAANKALSAASVISVPDIDHEPTEDDLTYTVNGETRSFIIGSMARYYNPDEEDYYFYQLYDITSDGKAYWKISGSGGAGGGSISVVITSNQGNDKNIASAVALFELVSTETGEGFEGGADMSIQDCSYKVSCTDVEGYNTPEPQILPMSSSAQTVYFEYTCEKVIITATPPDGIDISDKIVTVTDSDGKVWLEEAYGTGPTVNLPFGTVYTVTMERITGYRKEKYTRTAGIDQREVNYVFTAIDESYMIIDTKDKTTGRVTVLNPNQLNTILSKIRGCLVEYEGVAKAHYLSDSDNSKYSNGKSAIIDGSDGDVMTYFPKVSYRYDDLGDGRIRYSIVCNNRPDDGYHTTGSCLIGQMKASVVDGVMRSVSGQTPVSGKSYNELLDLAKSRGEGFGLIDWEAHCLIAMLLYCKYGTTDLQGVIGHSKAYFNQDNRTGTTLSLGTTDSHPEVYSEDDNVTTEANYTTWNRALCLEGVFGGLYEYMQGVKYVNGTWYVTDRDGTERAIKTQDSATGWITNMALENGPLFDLIPTGNSGGSGSTYYADYAEMASGDFIATHAARGCFSDPNADPFPDDGVAYINATTGANEPSEFYSTRIAYYGQITFALEI